MLAGFLIGVVCGIASIWILYLSARREIVKLDEEKQLVQQEKQIVLEFMHNLVEGIGEGIKRKDLFQRIVHAALLSTGALSACAYERLQDGRLRGISVEGLFPPQHPLSEKSIEKISTRAKYLEQVLKTEVFKLGEGLIGAVGRSGRAVLIEDALKDPRVVKHNDPSLQVRSLIVTPLLFRNKVLGVLAVANPADGMVFTETDFSLVQSLSEQAALAIHNSDLMQVQIDKNRLDFDIEMAGSIQGMILPKEFPRNTQLDIAATYKPAQKIGGDLYDVFALGDDRVGIAIADVSGKGVPASLLMAICHANLRNFAKMFDSPAEVLRHMNAEMQHEMHRHMFITLTYAIIDTTHNTLTLARAGHELLMMLRKQSDRQTYNVEMVSSEGMALGMVPEAIFNSVIEDKRIPFEQNDIAVFYTDGVTEAANPEDVEFSARRLGEVVHTLRDRPARELNQGIVAGVERFTQEHTFLDDITLVTVKHL